MRIPESTLSEIRSRIDIAEVIAEHVTLQRRGGRYWGLCPFHQEKSASFTVTPDKGVYYCFGCHKGGTVFDFVMEIEKVPWRDAVEILAKKAGIEIPQEDEEQGGIKRGTFFELYRRVAGSFHWLLTEGAQAESARKYLAGRGLQKETIEGFQLGYAPLDRDWLFQFLAQKSYSREFLAKTGLFIESAGGSSSALFANRIIFPISNARGEIIAFGGRALGDSQPKYLNSPETAFFRKRENLFGIDKAAAAIRGEGFFILVEGYMDVLALHQAGIANCIAPLGTALTEQQVRLLKRYAAKAVVLFDGDDAGQKATSRAIEMLEKEDLIVQVVELPGGQDPADFVQKGEVGALKDLLARSGESFPYLMRKAVAAHDRSSTEGREGIRDQLFPFIAAPASQMRRDRYLTLLADELDADQDALRQDYSAWSSRRRVPGLRAGQGTSWGSRAERGAPGEGRTEERRAYGEETRKPAHGESGALSADLFLMLAVAANRDLFPLVRNGGVTLADLDDEMARTLFVALEESYRAEDTGFEALCARIDDAAARDLAIRKVSSGEFDMNQERMVADGVRRIRQRTLRKRIDAVSVEMRKAEKESRDSARVRELLVEKMHLDSELEKLKTRAAGV
jgi:DNA primase